MLNHLQKELKINVAETVSGTVVGNDTFNLTGLYYAAVISQSYARKHRNNKKDSVYRND